MHFTVSVGHSARHQKCSKCTNFYYWGVLPLATAAFTSFRCPPALRAPFWTLFHLLVFTELLGLAFSCFDFLGISSRLRTGPPVPGRRQGILPPLSSPPVSAGCKGPNSRPAFLRDLPTERSVQQTFARLLRDCNFKYIWVHIFSCKMQ